MSICQLCGKDLSEDGNDALCENCQSLPSSIAQNQRTKTTPPKRKFWQRLLPILLPVLFALIINYIPRIGTADAKEHAEHAVQELVLSESGVLPYTKAQFAGKSPASVLFTVDYSATQADMNRRKYQQRLVAVSLNGKEINFISDPVSSDETKTP